jgi:predicted regulator of Ras-like GTPase activity (Roadblock/LC7/MglB family)
MDAARALAELTDLSSQIDQAVIVDAKGGVLASTIGDVGRAARVAEAAVALGRAAEDSAPSRASLAQVHATLADGSVFLVTDGARTIAAVTRPDPVAGLVLYDLKATLRSIGEPDPPAAKKKATPRKRAASSKTAAPARKPPRKDTGA